MLTAVRFEDHGTGRSVEQLHRCRTHLVSVETFTVNVFLFSVRDVVERVLFNEFGVCIQNSNCVESHVAIHSVVFADSGNPAYPLCG